MVLPVVLLLCSCATNDNDVVAEVYGYKLRRADVEGIVEVGMSREDSLALVDNYVDQWIQQMVVLEQAKVKVNKSFEKELENYRNSLLTYEYEQLVVDAALDTHVTTREISEYYNANQENFTLQTSIVKAMYVKFAKDAPPVKNVIKLMSSSKLSDKEMDEIQNAVALYGQDYSFDIDTWQPFYKFQSQVPITTYNEELYLKNNHNIVIEDSASVYIARIMEYRLSEQVSPLSYESEHIKAVILNGRKIELIKNMQRKLLKDADEQGKIRKYKL